MIRLFSSLLDFGVGMGQGDYGETCDVVYALSARVVESYCFFFRCSL